MNTGNAPFGGNMTFAADTGNGSAGTGNPDSPEASDGTEAEEQTTRLSAAAALLGEIVWLLGRSDSHKHVFLTELDWMVMPPIPLRQFRIWRQNNQPVAYASWAFLSDEISQRFVDGVSAGRVGRLAPGEWKSGENLWLIDFVAPFGGNDAMIEELREKVFPGQKVRTIQRAPDGSGISINDL